MVEEVRPSVVKLLSRSLENDAWWGQGTGFIIGTSEDGSALVLTDQHVVSESQSTVAWVNDSEWVTATVEYLDPRRDIALLEICCGDFQPVEFMDTQFLRPGDEVISIGYPVNGAMPRKFTHARRTIVEGEATVTRGIVSAFRYKSEFDAQVLQFDAPSNPGNSGGPLFLTRWQGRGDDGLHPQ